MAAALAKERRTEAVIDAVLNDSSVLAASANHDSLDEIVDTVIHGDKESSHSSDKIGEQTARTGDESATEPPAAKCIKLESPSTSDNGVVPTSSNDNKATVQIFPSPKDSKPSVDFVTPPAKSTSSGNLSNSVTVTHQHPVIHFHNVSNDDAEGSKLSNGAIPVGPVSSLVAQPSQAHNNGSDPSSLSSQARVSAVPQSTPSESIVETVNSIAKIERKENLHRSEAVVEQHLPTTANNHSVHHADQSPLVSNSLTQTQTVQKATMGRNSSYGHDSMAPQAAPRSNSEYAGHPADSSCDARNAKIFEKFVNSLKNTSKGIMPSSKPSSVANNKVSPALNVTASGLKGPLSGSIPLSENLKIHPASSSTSTKPTSKDQHTPSTVPPPRSIHRSNNVPALSSAQVPSTSRSPAVRDNPAGFAPAFTSSQQPQAPESSLHGVNSSAGTRGKRKWCGMHGQIAWEIYRNQKEQSKSVISSLNRTPSSSNAKTTKGPHHQAVMNGGQSQSNASNSAVAYNNNLPQNSHHQRSTAAPGGSGSSNREDGLLLRQAVHALSHDHESSSRHHVPASAGFEKSSKSGRSSATSQQQHSRPTSSTKRENPPPAAPGPAAGPAGWDLQAHHLMASLAANPAAAAKLLAAQQSGLLGTAASGSLLYPSTSQAPSMAGSPASFLVGAMPTAGFGYGSAAQLPNPLLEPYINMLRQQAHQRLGNQQPDYSNAIAYVQAQQLAALQARLTAGMNNGNSSAGSATGTTTPSMADYAARLFQSSTPAFQKLDSPVLPRTSSSLSHVGSPHLAAITSVQSNLQHNLDLLRDQPQWNDMQNGRLSDRKAPESMANRQLGYPSSSAVGDLSKSQGRHHLPGNSASSSTGYQHASPSLNAPSLQQYPSPFNLQQPYTPTCGTLQPGQPFGQNLVQAGGRGSSLPMPGGSGLFPSFDSSTFAQMFFNGGAYPGAGPFDPVKFQESMSVVEHLMKNQQRSGSNGDAIFPPR